jgi:hypothetical protein
MTFVFAAEDVDCLIYDALTEGRLKALSILLKARSVDENLHTPRCLEALKLARTAGHIGAVELFTKAQDREHISEFNRRERSFSPVP